MYFRSEGYIPFDITNIVKSWDEGDHQLGLVVRAINEDGVGSVARFYSDDSVYTDRHAYIKVTCNN